MARFTIKCNKCGLVQPCKPYLMKVKSACKCGYIFTEKELNKALEEVRKQRKN